MSQVTHGAVYSGDTPEEGIQVGDGDPWSPPQSAQYLGSRGESNFVDGSGPLFAMYVDMAIEEDKKMAESWQADADGILVFTGLFSAAVAAFIAVSIQDLRPSSQDTSAFYLANIYRTIAEANGTHVSIPSVLSDPSIPFSPPEHAVLVNSLWFLSLAISLTCALLATLLQQWARRYVKMTQSRYSPHKRARIRAFFAEGVDKPHLPWAVGALPTLLHLSLFIFFAGLVVFLFNVNHTVFTVVVWWFGICMAVYLSVTFMPIFRHDSPYLSPLSSSAWFLFTGVLSALFGTLRRVAYAFSRSEAAGRFGDLNYHYKGQFLKGMGKIAEESALHLSSEIDGRSLMWTFEALDEDHELERFFAGIPGFSTSKLVRDPVGAFFKPYGDKMSVALIGLMHRTLSSNLVSVQVRQRRTAICIRALEAASLPINRQILGRVLYGEWGGLLSSVEFGRFLSKINYNDPFTAYHSQCVISLIIKRAQERDDRWFELAMGHLGVSRSVLQNYLAHGDSISLANCIHICRQVPHAYSSHHWTVIPSMRIGSLELFSRFDMRNTLPGLQHDFCALWNETLLETRKGDSRAKRVFVNILRNIRGIYIDLHKDTGAAPIGFSAATDDNDTILLLPSSYTPCNDPSHHQNSTSRASNERVCTAGEITNEGAVMPMTSSLAQAVPHHRDESVPIPASPPTAHNVPPSSTPELDHNDIRPEDGPPHHGANASIIVSASRDLAPDSVDLENHIPSCLSLGTTASTR